MEEDSDQYQIIKNITTKLENIGYAYGINDTYVKRSDFKITINDESVNVYVLSFDTESG